MALATFIIFGFLLYTGIIYFHRKNFVSTWKNHLFLILFIGIAIRLLTAFIVEGHPTDISCFKGWANSLFIDGISNFYASEGFTDYPPGFMYVLYVIGMVKNVFKLDYYSDTFLLLIKMPSMIADVLSGVFLYTIAKRHMKANHAFVLSLLYVLNPVTILNTSFWGQVDSIHTLTLVISIYFLTEKKLLKSLLIFVISFIVKPQAFMFSPVYLFAMYYWMKERKWSGKAFVEMMKYAGICIALIIALLFPFASWAEGYPDVKPIITQYINTLGSYNYTTVNAYNIYALFRLNWVPLSNLFLGIPYSVWGVLALVLIVFFAFYTLKRADVRSNYFFTSALISICTFVFSVKMHERYCFPVLLFLLAAYIYRQDKRILYSFVGFTITLLIHFIDVLNMSIQDYNYSLIDDTMVVIAFLIILVFVYMIVSMFFIYKKNVPDAVYSNSTSSLSFIEHMQKANETRPSSIAIMKSDSPIRYTKIDFIALSAITLIYTVIAFLFLGDLNGAKTPWIAERNETVDVDFGQQTEISRVQFMINARHNQEFSLAFSTDGINYEAYTQMKAESPVNPEWKDGDVFKWEETSSFNWKEEIENTDNSPDTTITEIFARYVKITAVSGELMLNEIAFRDMEDNIVPIASISGRDEAKKLFDEQSLVPTKRTYMNSTYFDEIYHARTGYEFLNDLNVYEYTHPPLGKLIISTGISIFGMTPFGWRFFGTFFGVLMLPFMYLFARRIFKNSFWASFVTVIFAFDFMHFAQTRLATIDTYITFFIIGMYYFMYKYITMNYNDNETKFTKTLPPLAFSGLFMGLGIASKWPGMYAGIGLAIIFFICLGRRFWEYRFAMQNPTNENIYVRETFKKHTIITLFLCILFFVIVPAFIYIASYVPYYFGNHGLYPLRENIWFWNEHQWIKPLLPDNTIGNFLAATIQTNVDIFRYHSNLVSEHSFSSPWYSWPLDIRPIYYYSERVSDTIRGGLSSFGNPAVWWCGLIALFFCIYKSVVQRSKKAIFLVIAYFAQIVPWVLVTRTTYIYHYFPCIPFLTLMLGYTFKDKICKKNLIPAFVFAGITIVLFIMFYPVLTGIPVSVWYVQTFLKWLPSWQLI